jgi:hypothetical protein
MTGEYATALVADATVLRGWKRKALELRRRADVHDL